MSKWEEKRLGEISKIVSGGTPSTNNGEYWGGKIGWITPNDLSNYNKVHIKNGERNITEEGLKNSSAKLLPKQTVLLTTRAPIGYVVIADEVLATNQGFKNIICNPDLVNYRYMYYLLKSNKLTLESFATGATFPELSASTLKRIKFIFPPINIQHKIIDIISFYDDLIENNNLRIKLLEKAAQNLYKEWFVRFRFPNYKQTKFENGMPIGWGLIKLKDYYKTTSGGTPSRKNENYYINGTYNWIKTGELNDRFIISTDEKITEEAIKKSSAKLIDKGSLIMAMYGATIGRLGFTIDESTCNQACCVFNPKYIDLSNEYLYFWLKANREFIINISFGAAQQNLSQDLINNLKILKPDKYIIELFDKLIKPILEEIKILQIQSNNLIKQRDLLLPRLMSGKLEV